MPPVSAPRRRTGTETLELLGPVAKSARRNFSGPQAGWLMLLLKSLARARFMLAKSSAEFSAAEAELLEAHSICAAEPDAPPEQDREIATNLAELYDRWHTAEPGKGYEAKSAEWKAKSGAAK